MYIFKWNFKEYLYLLSLWFCQNVFYFTYLFQFFRSRKRKSSKIKRKANKNKNSPQNENLLDKTKVSNVSLFLGLYLLLMIVGSRVKLIFGPISGSQLRKYNFITWDLMRSHSEWSQFLKYRWGFVTIIRISLVIAKSGE